MTVRFEHGELDTGVLAVARLTWFQEGRQTQVEELAVVDSPEGCAVVLRLVELASEQGYDLTVLSEQEFCDCYAM